MKSTLRYILIPSAWSPRGVFTGSTSGAWYDIRDRTTLFQDVAGTIPVTDFGQTVALVKDKSGFGNNLKQGAAASRPVYTLDDNRPCLVFDGVDDLLITASTVNLSASPVFFMSIGYSRLSDLNGYMVEFGHTSSGTAPGSFAFRDVGTSIVRWVSFGTVLASGTAQASAIGERTVASGTGDLANNRLKSYFNGTFTSTITTDQVGTTYIGDSQLCIGSRTTAFGNANFRFFGSVLLDYEPTTATRKLIEKHLAGKTGVNLA